MQEIKITKKELNYLQELMKSFSIEGGTWGISREEKIELIKKLQNLKEYEIKEEEYSPIKFL